MSDADTLPAVEAAGRISLFVLTTRGVRARAYQATNRPDDARSEIGPLEVELAQLPRDDVGGRASARNVSMVGESTFGLLSDASVEHLAELVNSIPDARAGASGSMDTYRGALSLRLDQVAEAEQHFRTASNGPSVNSVRSKLAAASKVSPRLPSAATGESKRWST